MDKSSGFSILKLVFFAGVTEITEIIWNFDWFWMNLNKIWPNSEKFAKNQKFQAISELAGGGEGGEITKISEISKQNLKPCKS